MQSIIYIYTKTGTTPIYQIFDPIGLTINRKISDISTAEFEIPTFENDGSISEVLKNSVYISEGNRVKIGIVKDGEEGIEFEGVMSGIIDTPLSTKVLCSDMLSILASRMILVDTTVSGNIATIVENIMTTINNTENTWITVASSSLSNTIPSKTYSAFTYALDIIKDLADQGNGTPIYFTIRDGVLYFDSVIGADLSSTVLFNYEYNDSYFRTIESFSFESDIKNIINATYTKSSAGVIFNAIDSASISTYGRREKGISAGNGDPSTEATNSNAKTKVLNREITITPTIQSFSLANIGDIVKVYINGGDIRRQFDGTMYVTGKEYIAGDIARVRYSLSNTSVISQTILEKIKDMDATIERLKIGTIT